MMSLVAWGTHYLIFCHAAHGLRYGTTLSGHLTLQWCGPALHCSCIVSAYPYVLQALTTQHARMICRPMMALTSGALETGVCAMGTCMPSCTGGHARLFFMLEARGP
jgi:hypothetical protein